MALTGTRIGKTGVKRTVGPPSNDPAFDACAADEACATDVERRWRGTRPAFSGRAR